MVASFVIVILIIMSVIADIVIHLCKVESKLIDLELGVATLKQEVRKNEKK